MCFIEVIDWLMCFYKWLIDWCACRVLAAAKLDKQLIGQATFADQLKRYVNSIGLLCSFLSLHLFTQWRSLGQFARVQDAVHAWWCNRLVVFIGSTNSNIVVDMIHLYPHPSNNCLTSSSSFASDNSDAAVECFPPWRMIFTW